MAKQKRGISQDPEVRARQLAARKDAPVGNQLGRSHGAYARVAEERLDDKAQRVFDALAADAPVRGPGGGLPAHDAVAVRLLAETLCRLEDVQAWIAEHGVFDVRPKRKAKNPHNRARSREHRKSKDPMRAIEMEDRLMRRAQDMLDALGMTPRSRVKLGLDMARAADLATAMSEEDPQRRAELLRDAGVIEGEAEDA